MIRVFMLFVVLVFASFLPSAAFAQGGNTESPTAITDCSKGCTIVTCDDLVCVVWHCDSTGCKRVGQYRNVVKKTDTTVPGHKNAFDGVCNISEGASCPIKVCKGPTCTISVFDGKQFVPIAEIENVDEILKEALKSKK